MATMISAQERARSSSVDPGPQSTPVLGGQHSMPTTRSESVRFLDVSPFGRVIEVLAGDGQLEISHTGESGWEKVASPTPDQMLRVKLFQKIAMEPWGPLFRAGLETVYQNVNRILRVSARGDSSTPDRSRIFAPASIGRNAKPILAIDIVEECHATDLFLELLDRYGYAGPAPAVYGEESLSNQWLDVSAENRPVVLEDVVDGTDEVEQGTLGWCSSMIIYYPPERRILAAFVGLPDKSIYFAIEDFVGRCRLRRDTLAIAPEVFALHGPSRMTNLDESLLAFYGHKPSRLDALRRDKEYQALLARMANSRRARIRTQGGQPAILGLADRLGYRQIDAVFEKLGQAPHDAIAALHIAQMVGATLCDLKGQPLDLCAKVARPADPASRIKYVLAASCELAGEICSFLGARHIPWWRCARLRAFTNLLPSAA